MSQSFSRGYMRYAVAAMLILSLAACSGLFTESGKKAKQVKSAKTQYTAGDYIKHLSMARLMPEDDAADVDIINAYAKQKPAKTTKTKPQALVVIDYKTEGEGVMRQVIAPVSLDKSSSEFPELFEIMSQLTATKYTLHNLHVMKVNLAPAKNLGLQVAGSDEVQPALARQHKSLLEKAAPLTLADEIRAELRLIRFFIVHHFRDGAYLTVDNVKKSIANLPHATPADIETVKQFSEELERLESDMRQAMPFTL